jgi:crossover junction endodeoxyribonuclease RuvC
MPSGSGAKVSNLIDAAGLAALLKNIISEYPGEYVLAVLERTSAMPGQGVSSMFSMGDSFGAIRGVLAAKGIPTELISPAKWKKAMGLSSDKEISRTMAIQLFPEQSIHFQRRRDHNRSEAALLGYWAWRERA